MAKKDDKPPVSHREAVFDQHRLSFDERVFCEAYAALGFRNAPRAYQRMFLQLNEREVNKTSAWNGAKRMLANANVRDTLEVLKERYLRNMEVTEQRVLEEFARIAFFDSASLFDPETGHLIPPHELPEDVTRAIAQFDIEEKTNRSGNPVYKYKYKAHSKVEALNSLARNLGLFERDNAQQQNAFVDAFFERAAAITAGQVPGALGSPADGPGSLAGPGVEVAQPLLPGRQER